MKLRNFFAIALTNAVLTTSFAEAKALKHNPNGPEIKITLPGQTEQIAIDADRLSKSGQETNAYIAQFDKDFTPFLEVPDLNTLKKTDPNLFEKIDTYSAHLRGKLRFQMIGLSKEGQCKIAQTLSYLVAKGVYNLKKIETILNTDYRQRSPDSKIGDLMACLNLVVNHPDSVKPEETKKLKEHLWSHFPNSPEHLKRVQSGYRSTTTKFQQLILSR